MGVARYWEMTGTYRGEAASQAHKLSVPYGPVSATVARKRRPTAFFKMINDALNLHTPDLKWTEKHGNETTTYKDPQATIAARENIVQLQQRWLDWLAAQGDRITPLVDLFNKRFNRTVLEDVEWRHA